MYSDKKNVLQLVALLEAHGITRVVLCPGSRNAPLVHTLSTHPGFTCYSMTDERSAGYFAIGLALNGGKPAAVCCTSGTALLNLHPAVAEAFYQHIPLVVISADRPGAWIGQMDGQTVPQPGVFRSLVKKSVDLPEIHTDEDEWYCNRLVNEALLETNHHGKGPVHINVPISEPLFRFTVESLPAVRAITRYQGLNVYDRDYNGLIDRLNQYNRRMIVVGQMSLIYLFEKRYVKLLYKHFAWLTEHIGNQTVPGIPVKNFDAALSFMPEERAEQMAPELLITYGGHVISKRLKKFLRQHPPKEHWHVSPDGEVVDLYGALTCVIEMDPFEFLEKIAGWLDNRTPEYPRVWENYCKTIPEPEFGYSGMSAVGGLIKSLPESCALHLANSSAVRYAQLYPIPSAVEVCGNRGTNGIEGSLSTAIGYAACSDKLNFVVIGDLSFFYDMNALWNGHIGANLRILLLNNGGGGIFHTLPGLEMSGTSHKFITAVHKTSAKGWAEERGFLYLRAENEEQLTEAVQILTRPEPMEQPVLVEVFTNKNKDARILKDYFKKNQ
ncbi:2-succinyl-5-enolpyruvyl-6-hydroxy-3-cyclohexene-1-carboxylic-acid synthase [Bacteroides pyogenes]|uniref:2-succinyl-5-enolpyruvyl-6-hydroxy-3- cyclohexene-1-carboxylic-acid synthase n=1 Tax=Bacteroides pyogenes TaxID=310300 RepID=UPI001BA510F8|nr:2-succinyl-5-enolpyruvyl-6-hydroxy-3-cyclohexene-1-carboxylic-acid synthase [Bacteroides pyogenes]MBR8704479.1 2-succinyl-5-enolpyruvyl-6-hydroxy-3-cyclohexene-1-carboxylate synthase [Bacteroides pyogenes]MBR8709151.1 2-succinyl-5-enolpyruvyl-6-hydroxy-3-cyclohexene-1-carboxylate synthase [Bacteroides pyogenes]MBR8717942.1 2-succinyl-5-enolpyruvyl-6-hydroxy-3-cyclohexene-1-carboxylate synthase [Bacteroides pyogenes]MBR8747443.1 2-succinyl-5-enolpyruvyl-6-hydroxy-3-cyclohexene-1-carboxylate s